MYRDRDIPVPLTAILCLLHRLWNRDAKTAEGKISPKLMLTGDLNKQNNHSLFQSYKLAKHPHQIFQTTAGVSGKRHQAAKSTSKESKKWLNRTKSVPSPSLEIFHLCLLAPPLTYFTRTNRVLSRCRCYSRTSLYWLNHHYTEGLLTLWFLFIYGN